MSGYSTPFRLAGQFVTHVMADDVSASFAPLAEAAAQYRELLRLDQARPGARHGLAAIERTLGAALITPGRNATRPPRT